MIKILKIGLKHVGIFYITNLLACFIIGASLFAYEELREHSMIYLFQGIMKAAFLALPLSLFAVFFTFLPYLVFITIIKLSKTESLAIYSFFGSLSPYILYIGALENISNNIGLLSLFIITGAVCGYVYGIMDLSRQSPHQKKGLKNAGDSYD